MWMQGIYFRDAIAACFNPNKCPYPKKPYGVDEVEQVNRPDIAAMKFREWAEEFNKKFEEEGA